MTTFKNIENTEIKINLNDSAYQHIKKMLNEKTGTFLRLSIKKMGCSGYQYYPELISEINPTDQVVITEQGLPIYIDSDYVHMIHGVHIDYVQKGLMQSQLQFTNPKAKDACGCGESFNWSDEKNND